MVATAAGQSSRPPGSLTVLQRVLETEVMDSAEEAASYDAMDHREPNSSFVQRLVELGGRGHMLDIGTGPGHMPILVCQAISSSTVVGVDMSQHMLKIAGQHLAASGLTDRISYQLADAKRLPWPDGAFDTVYSNTILHHIPDPRPYLCEAVRVLRPGGVLLIRDLYRPPTQQQLDELVAQHAGDATADQRAMFADSLHAALTPDELRAMVERLSFTDLEVVVDTDRHMSLQRPR